jgi:hypothetical protein
MATHSEQQDSLRTKVAETGDAPGVVRVSESKVKQVVKSLAILADPTAKEK